MLLNEADKIYVGSALVAKVYLGATLVWPLSASVETTVSQMRFDAVFGALQVVSTSAAPPSVEMTVSELHRHAIFGALQLVSKR